MLLLQSSGRRRLHISNLSLGYSRCLLQTSSRRRWSDRCSSAWTFEFEGKVSIRSCYRWKTDTSWSPISLVRVSKSSSKLCASNLDGDISSIATQLEPSMEADVVVAIAGGRDEAGPCVDVGVGHLGSCPCCSVIIKVHSPAAACQDLDKRDLLYESLQYSLQSLPEDHNGHWLSDTPRLWRQYRWRWQMLSWSPLVASRHSPSWGHLLRCWHTAPATQCHSSEMQSLPQAQQLNFWLLSMPLCCTSSWTRIKREFWDRQKFQISNRPF